jgi:hypothetical protein
MIADVEMTMIGRLTWLVVALLFASAPLDTKLVESAAVVKPVAAELRWQQIPWLTDLTQGLSVARSEHRPIFLWVTGDDPLERC